MSNIDEEEVNKDIEFIKELIEKDKIDIKGISYGKQYRILRTIKNILTEREQKDKRIKELEEENSDLKIKNNSRIIGSYAEVRLEEILKEKYIPIQKVKDKIEEYKDTAKRIAGTYQYADSGDDLLEKRNRVIELKNKAEVLEDLLEDK